MKEKASSQTEAVWACLHGELTDDERNAFEQDLQSDGELRKTFDDAAQMDRLLRETLPLLDQTDTVIDKIAEQALTSWEKDFESEQNSASECVRPLAKGRVRPAWYRFICHPAVGVVGLAAAAVVLLFSPVLRTPEGLLWDEPVFASLTLRGSVAPEEQGSSLSKETAERCQTLLQTELMRALSETGSDKKPLIVSLHLQELRNGAFSVSVRVRTRKDEIVGEWSGDYSGEEAFKEQVGASAEQIASTLSAWPYSGNGGNP